jgi:starvation-inducible outer membrane lipoprotein
VVWICLYQHTAEFPNEKGKKMTKIKLLLVFFLAVVLGACITPKAKLTLRYKSQKSVDSTANNLG